MKKLFLLLTTGALLGLASCERVQEMDSEEGRQTAATSEEVDLIDAIKASYANPDTKIVSDWDGSLAWANGDRLMVSMHGNEPVEYDLVSGAGTKTAFFKTSHKAESWQFADCG